MLYYLICSSHICLLYRTPPASLYLAQEDIKSRMSTDWSRDTHLSKCHPRRKLGGDRYCKHDAIFTLITAGDGSGDKDDDHITETQCILVLKNKTFQSRFNKRKKLYMNLQAGVSLGTCCQCHRGKQAWTLQLMWTVLWALLAKRARTWSLKSVSPSGRGASFWLTHLVWG